MDTRVAGLGIQAAVPFLHNPGIVTLVGELNVTALDIQSFIKCDNGLNV